MSRALSRLGIVTIFGCCAAACSGAPQREPTARQASPLDPTQVLEPTYYTITLSQVHVDVAQEPNQADPGVYYPEYCTSYCNGTATRPGKWEPGTAESCNQGYSELWTPDTGYVDVAQLGVMVTPTQSGGMPYNAGMPQATSCSLGSAKTGQTLSTCANYGFHVEKGLVPSMGAPLSIPFYVNPGDKVALALGLDNVESAPNITSMQSQIPDSTSADIKEFGDGAMTVGAAIALAGDAVAPEAAVIGFVGNVAGFAGDLLGSSATVYECSAQQEAGNASSCTGGLMGAWSGFGYFCSDPNNGPDCGHANYFLGEDGASAGKDTCTYSQAPPDVMRIADPTVVDPATNLPAELTAERLLQLTAAGPASFEFAFSADEDMDCSLLTRGSLGVWGGPDTAGSYQHLYWNSTQPRTMVGCDSHLRVDVTISRNYGEGVGGPAASARSGDMAVVRSAGTIDTFNVDPAQPSYILHHSGSGSSFAQEFEAPAETLQAAGVTLSTAPVVVSRTPNNVDMFWTDDKGGLYTAYEAGPNFAWQAETIVPPGYCIYRRLGTVSICEWMPSIVPVNATVTATARSPGNLDVFFIGTDGNVYNAYWSTAMGVNAQGQPNWKTIPITTGACTMTNESCAGRGQPGSGVAVVARTPTHLDLFYVGSDGGIWSSWWDATATSWTTEELYGPHSYWQYTAGAVPTSATLTAVARTENNLDVFFLGIDGGLWTTTWQNGGSWWSQEILGTQGTGQPGGPISAVARQPVRMDVVYGAAAGGMGWDYFSSPSWAPAPLAIPAGSNMSPKMTGRGAISLVAPDSYRLQAFYLNPQHQLETLTWFDGDCNLLWNTGCTLGTQDTGSQWQGPTSLAWWFRIIVGL
jgi:hypothetical protein